MSRRSAFFRGAVLGAALCLALAACDDLTSLDQDAPSRIPADQLDKPENAALLVRGTVGDFECALANYIVAGGLVADELGNAVLANDIWDFDRRTITPVNAYYATNTCGENVAAPTVYTVLSTVRYDSDHTVQLLDGWTDEQVPDRTSLIATASAYGGYSLVLLGEGMCSAAIDVGPELTRPQLLAEAEARLTRAIDAATASGETEVLNLALVGRARARLGQGNLAGAAADAAMVPPGFVVNATYSSAKPRRENLVFTYMNRELEGTVDLPFRDLKFAGVPDPRVVVTGGVTVGADAVTPIFQPGKYPSINTPIPVARWEEAQLILAETAVSGGSPQVAVDIINTLHANVGLPPYAGGTPAEVMAQVVEERSRELFLEGQRLGDMIRYNLPLFPATGTPFPVAGGTFGDQVCFPLPAAERLNNPNIPD
jgi:starch-binding outer membrane protein, SusD/RagB family